MHYPRLWGSKVSSCAGGSAHGLPQGWLQSRCQLWPRPSGAGPSRSELTAITYKDVQGSGKLTGCVA